MATTVTQEYNVDLSSNNNFIQIAGVEGDGNEVRYVILYLYANGSEYEIADDTVAYVIGTKSDGTEIFNECTIDGNTVTVEITQQMLASVGRGTYQIMLLDSTNNTAIKTFPFILLVTEAAVDVDYVESSDEWQALIDALAQAEEGYEEVVEYAEAAETSATNAATSEANALTSETNASTYATNAETSATNAATSETNAATSETNAATSATNAATSEANAETSATNAATSESNAEASATLAESYAVGGTGTRTDEDTDNAMYYAEQASTSATNAATSETNAATSETNAATSATNAATSETNAATSETNAATSATNAATSETNAATSATNAATSETNAETNAILSESYAVGGTGTRTDEDTDNSKYYYEQSNAILEDVKDAVGETVPTITLDLTDGHLYYESARIEFTVEDGYLMWGYTI